MDEAKHKKNFKTLDFRDLIMDKNPRAGKPIPHETSEKRHSPQEWDQLEKDYFYVIAGIPYRNSAILKI